MTHDNIAIKHWMSSSYALIPSFPNGFLCDTHSVTLCKDAAVNTFALQLRFFRSFSFTVWFVCAEKLCVCVFSRLFYLSKINWEGSIWAVATDTQFSYSINWERTSAVWREPSTHSRTWWKWSSLLSWWLNCHCTRPIRGKVILTAVSSLHMPHYALQMTLSRFGYAFRDACTYRSHIFQPVSRKLILLCIEKHTHTHTYGHR